MTDGATHTGSPWILTEASLDLLKLLAMMLMVFDHVNESVLGGRYGWMSLLGRGAYPLFAYAMACYLVRKPQIEAYLQRLVLFALISQPCFMLASHDSDGNVLFTLAFGAIAGQWVVGEARWRLHFLCALGLTAFFFNDFIDYGMAGIAMPAAIACVLRGEKRAWPWLLLITIALNAEFSDFFEQSKAGLQFTSIEQSDILPAIFAIALPCFLIAICKSIQGQRFLHKYAMYIFYPGHLAALGCYRLWTEAFPTSLIF